MAMAVIVIVIVVMIVMMVVMRSMAVNMPHLRVIVIIGMLEIRRPVRVIVPEREQPVQRQDVAPSGRKSGD